MLPVPEPPENLTKTPQKHQSEGITRQYEHPNTNSCSFSVDFILTVVTKLNDSEAQLSRFTTRRNHRHRVPALHGKCCVITPVDRHSGVLLKWMMWNQMTEKPKCENMSFVIRGQHEMKNQGILIHPVGTTISSAFLAYPGLLGFIMWNQSVSECVPVPPVDGNGRENSLVDRVIRVFPLDVLNHHVFGYQFHHTMNQWTHIYCTSSVHNRLHLSTSTESTVWKVKT